MKRWVEVTMFVEVQVDETKFDEKFMQEFRDSFYPFQRIEDHIEYLAQLAARGLINGSGDEFIEGYGPANEMGIDIDVRDVDMQLVDE